MLRKTILSLAMMSSAGVSSAEAEGFAIINDRPFLDLVGGLEGPDGYDDVVMSASHQPDRPITEMTIAEVLDYQRSLQIEGSASSAVGRFQFIRKTLNWLVEEHDISKDKKFDRNMQDTLARIMMVKCGFYERDAKTHAIGNCLARAWAALPVITGEKAGISYYADVGSNEALTSREEVLATLRERFAQDEPTRVQVALSRPLPAITNRDDEPFAVPIPLQP